MKQSRSSSVGAAPRINPLNRSRAQSSQPAPLEVRCGCQFFQSDSLLPERVNPIGSRPSSRIGGQSDVTSASSKNNIIDEFEENLTGSLLSFGVVTTTDYYAETNTLSRPTSHEAIPSLNNEHPSERMSLQQSTYSQFTLPKNTIPTFEIDRPSLLQKYKPVSNAENYNAVSTNRPLQPTATPVEPIAPIVNRHTKPEFSSQKSLDRYSQSTMLNRYRARSQSQAPSLQDSSVDIQKMPNPTPTEQIKTIEPIKLISTIKPIEPFKPVASVKPVVSTNPIAPVELIAPIVNRKTKPEFSSQKSLDRYSHSTMLNRYRSKSQAPSLQGSNVDIRKLRKIEPIESVAPVVNRLTKPEFSSQRSLDRYSQSTMLNRYRPKSKSQAPSLQGSNIDIRLMPKITKTVSFDYGRPLISVENGNTQRNYPVSSYMEADQYHRMTPMVFPVKERLEILRMSENR